MEPVVANLQEEYGDSVDFKSYDTMEERGKADKYNVTYVPTFVFIDEEGMVSARVVGQQSLEYMRTKLEELLE